jgi:peptide/nickel transport system substrate-binding protein
LAPWPYDTDKARSVLAEAGYPDGFDVKIITYEALGLEAKIASRMLECIGLKPQLEILTFTGWLRRVYMPFLVKSPEEQDWDIAIEIIRDYYGHTGAMFVTYPLIEESNMRWIESDPLCEGMFKEMATTVDREAQEERIREMVRYDYDKAYVLFIYSPIHLYAVNKEVSFVPYKFGWLRFMETSVTDNHWSIREEN